MSRCLVTVTVVLGMSRDPVSGVTVAVVLGMSRDPVSGYSGGGARYVT